MPDMNAVTEKALKSALKEFGCRQISFDGWTGIALVDKSFETPVAEVLAVADDGRTFAGRLQLDGADLAKAVEKAAAVGSIDAPGQPVLSEALEIFGLRDGACFEHALVGWARIRFGEDVQEEVVRDFARALLARGGVSAVAEKLNLEAVDALSATSSFKAAHYAFYAAEGSRGEYRRQAARSYPIFAIEMSDKFSAKFAIDRGDPLADVLMKSFGAFGDGTFKLSKGLLKRFLNKDWKVGEVPLAMVVEVLSRLPVDWFPKDEDEWNALVDLTGSAFTTIGPVLDWDVVGMTKGSQGKWRQLLNAIADAAADKRPPDDAPEGWEPTIDASYENLKAIANGTLDVVRTFRDMIAMPIAAASGGGVPVYLGQESLALATETSARIIYGGRTLQSMVELSRHWHTQEHNILNAVEKEPEIVRGKVVDIGKDGWAPLCDEWEAPNGVIVKPLVTTRELKDEGAGWSGSDEIGSDGVAGLAFCVGGYTSQCRAGTSHIISFRKPVGDSYKRLSAAEFRDIKADSTELNCVQHRGKGNGAPPAEAKVAYDWFVGAVKNGQIPLNHDGVMQYMSKAAFSREDVAAWSGYDWKDAENLDLALAPWGIYMPKRLRGADVPALMRSEDMDELCQTLAPTYRRAMTR